MYLSQDLRIKDFFRGSVVGFSTVLFGYPFDTIKVNLQNRNFYSMTNTFTTIYYNQGFRGFYRGSQYPFIFMITKRTYQYPLYEKLKNHTNYFLAGAVTGISGTFFGCPMQNIKVRIQNKLAQNAKNNLMDSENKKSYSIYSITKEIINKKGWEGFYLGFYPTLTRDFFYSGSFLGFYGIFREKAKDYNFDNKLLDNVKYGFCSGLSSMLTWTIFIPIDTIKNNIQSDKTYQNIIDRIHQDGIRKTLWAGYTPALIRTLPVSIITFIIYEWLK